MASHIERGSPFVEVNAMRTEADRIARLRMDARYHRERRDLYRAKMYGRHATSPERLRELERAYDRAAELLRAAEARRDKPAPPG
jgi:hypothetical protein